MKYTIVNANHDNPTLDLRLSELIYNLESNHHDINNIVIKQLNTIQACHEVHDLIMDSDITLYVCPLDSSASLNRLNKFLEHYIQDHHPDIYLILDSERLLTVDEVTEYIDKFEAFAEMHHANIIDVQYFKDAKKALQQ